ncbi:hypothetical protein Pmar_PMAR009784, partial [Perkinsus marinus ATCC 50983]
EDLREQFGSDVFQDLQTVMSCQSDAAAEIAVFGRTMLLSDMSTRVFKNRDKLHRLSRYSLVLYNALVSTMLRVTGCGLELLDPVVPPLKEFSRALEASRFRLVEDMVKPELLKTHPPPLDNINLTMQECVDAFLGARRDMVLDALNGSDRAIRITNAGGFRVYHLVYALSVFAELWTGLESELIGRQRPCEMIRLSTDMGDAHRLLRTMSTTLPSAADAPTRQLTSRRPSKS